MHFLLLTTLLTLLLPTYTSAQIAAGGGIAISSAAPLQFPIVGKWPQLVTAAGVTSTIEVVYTQTFAAPALGTWALGAAPAVGSIGLGDIAGTVGGVRTKANRGLDAVQTPGPMV